MCEKVTPNRRQHEGEGYKPEGSNYDLVLCWLEPKNETAHHIKFNIVLIVSLCDTYLYFSDAYYTVNHHPVVCCYIFYYYWSVITLIGKVI